MLQCLLRLDALSLNLLGKACESLTETFLRRGHRSAPPPYVDILSRCGIVIRENFRCRNSCSTSNPAVEVSGAWSRPSVNFCQRSHASCEAVVPCEECDPRRCQYQFVERAPLQALIRWRVCLSTSPPRYAPACPFACTSALPAIEPLLFDDPGVAGVSSCRVRNLNLTCQIIERHQRGRHRGL